MKKAYYARPISIDDTPQADRDMDIIKAIGFEPYPVGVTKRAALDSYAKLGMVAFRPYVEHSDILVFRAFPDGSIGAGVAQEILWAQQADKPVLEIPHQIVRRTLSVDETREMLKELGER